MGDRRCCCVGCWSDSDSFSRADNTNLGAEWNEISGDWQIVSNELYEAGNAGATVIFLPNPGDPRALVNYSITSEAVNDIYILIVNYVDGSNYMYAKLECNNGNNAVVSLHSVIGGADTELDSQTIDLLGFPSSLRIFTVCLSSSTFSVEISNVSAEMCVWTDTGYVHATGYRAGIRNGANQAITIDNFVHYEHWESDPTCPDCCPCKCDTTELSKNLISTYQGEDECDVLDGIEIPLTNNIGWQYWDGTLTDCSDVSPETGTAGTGDDCCEALIGLKHRLVCPDSDDPTDFELVIDVSDLVDGKGCQYAGDGKYGPNTFAYYADAASVCTPALNLIFKIGPGYPASSTCPDVCWNCGRQNPASPPPLFKTEYTIYVTEAP